MIESQAREEICRVGRSLFERGYVHATAGNISVRLDDGFLITPTDACLGFLDPAALAKVDLQGRQVAGAAASKTLVLHRRIYEAHAPLGTVPRCVIHSHSTHCVALTLGDPQGELLPPITPYFVMKVGHVPLVPYHRPGAPEVAALVAQQITANGEAGHPIRAVFGTGEYNGSRHRQVFEHVFKQQRLILFGNEVHRLLDRRGGGRFC